MLEEMTAKKLTSCWLKRPLADARHTLAKLEQSGYRLSTAGGKRI